MKPTTTLAGLGAAAVLLTGGIALAVDANDSTAATTNAAQTSSPTTSTSTSPTSTAPPSTAPPTDTPATTKVDPREAAAIAVKRVGGGTVSDLEWESEYGRQEWKVEVVHRGQEVDVRIDAQSGKITRVERDGVETRDDKFDRDDRDDRDDDDHSGHGRGGDDRDDRDDHDNDSGHGDDD